MNQKHRSILSGRKPRTRYSRKAVDKVFGISPLRAALNHIALMDAMRQEIFRSLGVPAYVARSDS